MATPEEAVAAARAIGFPVVLKAVAPSVPHKSDAGLVLLGLADADAVLAGAKTLVARCRALNAPLEGILVAQQVSDGLETVLGIHRDAEVGPVVMFGLGGVMVELFKDVAFGPPQLDRAAAGEMIDATRAATAARRLPRQRAARSRCVVRCAGQSRTPRSRSRRRHRRSRRQPVPGARGGRLRARRPRRAADRQG